MKILIGIDPDVDKSGYAERKGDDITLKNLTFFELFDRLKLIKLQGFDMILVVVEAGWLNKSNWHTTKGSNHINAKIGERTGANFETGKKIVEMLEHLDITYKTVRPTQRKLDAKRFKMITGIDYRTNQDCRDALMLIWGM